jgi:phage tail-like protein
MAGTSGGDNQYVVLANAYGFGVDIPGCADASKNIRDISIDELNIDCRETTTGLDVEYRTYSPGAAHWGQAKFTSACTLGGSKELQLWWQEAAKGKGIRKNITVTLFKSDKSPGRSYSLFECFPTQWSSVNFDTSSTVQTETLSVKVGRIEFKAG